MEEGLSKHLDNDLHVSYNGTNSSESFLVLIKKASKELCYKMCSNNIDIEAVFTRVEIRVLLAYLIGIIIKNKMVIWVQILDETLEVYLCFNTLWKGMNLSLLGEFKGKLDSFAFEKENSELKPPLPRLKIGIVSDLTHGQGIGEMNRKSSFSS